VSALTPSMGLVAGFGDARVGPVEGRMWRPENAMILGTRSGSRRLTGEMISPTNQATLVLINGVTDVLAHLRNQL